MQIITQTCPDCGTVVAGNVLEVERVMTCPGLECETVLSFQDLDEAERAHLEDYRERYRMD